MICKMMVQISSKRSELTRQLQLPVSESQQLSTSWRLTWTMGSSIGNSGQTDKKLSEKRQVVWIAWFVKSVRWQYQELSFSHHSKKVDGRTSNTERWIWLAIIMLCKLTFSDSSEAPKKRSTQAACHCWIIPCFQSCNCGVLPEKRQAVKGRGGGDVSYGSPFGQSEIIGSSM